MATQGRNVYGGSLGLYWPDGQNRRAFFLGPLFPQPDDLASALVHAIQGTLLNRRPSPRCSWTALRDAHTRNALQSLRDSGSTDLDEYIRTFDAEIAERDRQLHEAETEILRQRLALAAQAAQLGSVGGSLLNPGTEQGLYPNELQAILLDAVQDAVDRALPGAGAQTAGDDDLAVLGQRLADGIERFGHCIIDEAAGVDDDQVGAFVLRGNAVAFGA